VPAASTLASAASCRRPAGTQPLAGVGAVSDDSVRFPGRTRSRGEGDSRTVGARERDGHSAAMVAVGNTGRGPGLNGDYAGPVGTTFCASLSPRRGHTRRDDKMRRRVGPPRAEDFGLGAEVERTGAGKAPFPVHSEGVSVQQKAWSIEEMLVARYRWPATSSKQVPGRSAKLATGSPMGSCPLCHHAAGRSVSPDHPWLLPAS
jgi:hypothetical protein